MGTVTVKTCELIGPALDWAVARGEGIVPFSDGISWIIEVSGVCRQLPKYSTDWSQGGPIIERESIDTFTEKKSYHDSWLASVARYQNAKKLVGWRIHQYGPTPLIAAMRCYVASKLGDTVQIPRELVP